MTMMSRNYARSHQPRATVAVGTARVQGALRHNAFSLQGRLIMIAARAKSRRTFLESMIAKIFPWTRLATDALARQNMKELEADQKTLLTPRTARAWKRNSIKKACGKQVLSCLKQLTIRTLRRADSASVDADPVAGLPATHTTMPYVSRKRLPPSANAHPNSGHTDAIRSEWGYPNRNRQPARRKTCRGARKIFQGN